jgi:hypothetical protein
MGASIPLRATSNYLQRAAYLQMPTKVPNSAHAQFIWRAAAAPREETRARSSTRGRQLMGLPSGDTVDDHRDRAIPKFCIYSEAGLTAGCAQIPARHQLFRSAEKID